LLASNKLVVAREREEVTLHPDDCALMAFYGPYEMTLRVVWEKRSMDNVNVFAGINDHNDSSPR
jgi:hypothetical protein